LSSQEYNHIIRILGNDIPGERKIIVGLTQIKGIGYNFATAIVDTLKINPDSSVGYLTESEAQAIEKLIADPSSANFPSWFFNRRKDIETGNDIHILTSDIDFTLRNDIERERITSSWRGYRHMYGLKVRGQRTRCTGRKGGLQQNHLDHKAQQLQLMKQHLEQKKQQHLEQKKQQHLEQKKQQHLEKKKQQNLRRKKNR
jgi:small subunit ribosomal protein S13